MDVRCNAGGVKGRQQFQCVQVFVLTVHGESWGPSLGVGEGTAVYQCSVCGAFVLTLYQDKTFNACVLQLFIKKKYYPCALVSFLAALSQVRTCTSFPQLMQIQDRSWLLLWGCSIPIPGHLWARGCSNTTLTADPGWLKALVYWLQYQLMATSFTEPLYKYKEKDPSWKKKKL